MTQNYYFKKIQHSGRKGTRGTDCTDEKYKGLIGYRCKIDTDRIEQFKSYQFEVFSPYYNWWCTSEVLTSRIYSENDIFYLEIETVNTIYTFERIKK